MKRTVTDRAEKKIEPRRPSTSRTTANGTHNTITGLADRGFHHDSDQAEPDSETPTGSMPLSRPYEESVVEVDILPCIVHGLVGGALSMKIVG